MLSSESSSVSFSDLVGLSIQSVVFDNSSLVEFETMDGPRKMRRDFVEFKTMEGRTFRMHHVQEDSETVVITKIVGDLDDLRYQLVRGTLEQVKQDPTGCDNEYVSRAWTHYQISTGKGSVTFHWLGESTSSCSERVHFEEFL